MSLLFKLHGLRTRPLTTASRPFFSAFHLSSRSSSSSPLFRALPRLTATPANAASTRSVFGLRLQSPWLLKIKQQSGRARSRSNYERKSSLSFLDSIPENFVFWGIIGLNGAVFLMWQFAQTRAQAERKLDTFIWMRENFMSSWHNFSSGRIWTPVTAMFSHSSFQHILFNMFTFYFLARPVLEFLGPRRFLSLYIGGGLAASFGSMLWHNTVKHRDVHSLGASGAVFAVNSFLACVAPKMIFQIYGIIPVPAWLFVSSVFAFDVYSAFADKRQETDTAGHVVGMLAGIAYFLLGLA